MMSTTDFGCLTISAGEGKYERQQSAGGPNYVYTVAIKSGDTKAVRRFTFHDSQHRYSQGIRTLSADDLMSAFACFVSDAQAGDLTFREFAGEFGYDDDSHSARQIHKDCKAALVKFRALYSDGRDVYDVLETLEQWR